MPCHHNLDDYLHSYIEGAQLTDAKGHLFRSVTGRSGILLDHPMSQADVFRMIRKRAEQAGIETAIGCHTFRSTGITEYLRNGGKLEVTE